MAWEDRWQNDNTPWDAGESPPALIQLLSSGTLPDATQANGERRRALVAGCGRGYDVLTLAAAGYEAIGLEIAPTARRRFLELKEERGLPASGSDVLITDFFKYAPQTPFDFAWDYTFLCALPPELRNDWRQRMARLLRSGADLVSLIFPVDANMPKDEGPPFPLEPEAVAELMAPDFERIRLEPVEHSHPKRAGREWLGHFRRR